MKITSRRSEPLVPIQRGVGPFHRLGRDPAPLMPTMGGDEQAVVRAMTAVAVSRKIASGVGGPALLHYVVAGGRPL